MDDDDQRLADEVASIASAFDQNRAAILDLAKLADDFKSGKIALSRAEIERNMDKLQRHRVQGRELARRLVMAWETLKQSGVVDPALDARMQQICDDAGIDPF